MLDFLDGLSSKVRVSDRLELRSTFMQSEADQTMTQEDFDGQYQPLYVEISLDKLDLTFDINNLSF